MELIFLLIVFAVIIVLLWFKRPLYQAIIGGILVMAVLFRFSFLSSIEQVTKIFTNWGSLSVLVSLYLITYFQRQLEARNQIKLAQQNLNGLINNRRLNSILACVFVGLLPSAAATKLCGEIMEDNAENYLEESEKAYITNWMRHVTECVLPTYTGVLLICSMSKIEIAEFMLYMAVPVIIIIALGYFTAIRKLPIDTGTPLSENRKQNVINLFKHLWSLILVLVLIIVFGISVVPAMLITIIACVIVYKFKANELITFIKTAFEFNLLVNTFLVLVLKEFVSASGVLNILPDVLSALPIPAFLVFALLFFFGGIVSGSNGIIALGTPLAIAAIPEGGAAFMALLMCMTHASNQISPTHVCVIVAADYFKVPLGQMIKKTIPSAFALCILSIVYYVVITMIF